MNTKHLTLILLVLFALTVSGAKAKDAFLPDNLNPIYDDMKPLARLGRGYPHDLAWSPDGKTIAVATTIGVWLYDPAHLDTEPQLLNTVPQRATALAYSRDGSLLAVGGDQISLWDMRTRTLLRTIEIRGTIGSLAISPDGKWIVSSNELNSDEYGVLLWDATSGKRIKTLVDDGIALSLAFSPDGEFLVDILFCDCVDFIPGVWKTENWEPTFQNYIGPAYGRKAFFSPDSRTLTIVNVSTYILLWTHFSSDEPQNRELSFDASHFSYQVPGVMYTPDSKKLLSVDEEGILRIGDITSLRLDKQIDLHWKPVQVTLSPDGMHLVGVDRSGSLRIWDAQSGTVQAAHDNIAIDGGKVVFSPDSQLLATTVGVWSRKTGEKLYAYNASGQPVDDLSFSEDGKWLATASSPGGSSFSVWDAASGKRLYSITAGTSAVTAVLFARDSDRNEILLSADKDAVRAWEPETGKPLDWRYPLKPNPWSQGPEHILYENGQLILQLNNEVLIGYPNQEDMSTRTLERGDYRQPVNIILGKFEKFFTAGWDGVVTSWSKDKLQFDGILSKHRSWIYSLALSGDEMLMASGGCGITKRTFWDGSPDCEGAELELWDGYNGDGLQQITPPTAHTEAIKGLAFSPDGKLMASSSDDGTVVFWGRPADD
jgi:WD40 repeat protein